jgi:hypothetical protein
MDTQDASSIIADAVDRAGSTEWFGTLEYNAFTGQLSVSKLHLGREYRDGQCLSAHCGYRPARPQAEVYIRDSQLADHAKLFCAKCLRGYCPRSPMNKALCCFV